MASFLQWRKFVFFDKDTVKDPTDNGKHFSLPAVTDSPALVPISKSIPKVQQELSTLELPYMAYSPDDIISCYNCTKSPLTYTILHMDGKIWLLTRSLQLTSFQAYKLRVTHLYQLKQHSILVSVGQDEHGINPLVKVWNLEKRDSGNPLCTRIFPAIPGNKPTEVSCLSVHETSTSWPLASQMAVWF
ncbi:hypothetical protein KUCAC02_003277 [Chaenocephalus aceratus]|uniref:Uncharacterized protein n=1 Tax=Chaenocephalus aceratus TaxID=36190 RepID=A0ACB9WKT3_CHAAC|nr:hypothetical protein KUCAC02_003277 [Chaenocephalus aceratus]